MPSKKGRRQASRQTQLSGKPRHRTGPRLTEAQLRGPVEASEASATEPVHHSAPIEDSRAEYTSAVAASPHQPPAMTLRARRERQAIALQAGPSLLSETLRIGIITGAIAAVLVGLKLGSDFGA